MEPAKMLVADMEAADKIVRKANRVILIITAALVVSILAFFVVHAIQEQDALKKLIAGESAIIQRQSDELNQIKANQAAMIDSLNRQDSYLSCLVKAPAAINCPKPVFTASPSTPTQNSATTAENSSGGQSPATPQPDLLHKVLNEVGL